MSRIRYGLKILPQLYKDKVKIGESRIIKENVDEWLRIRAENHEKISKINKKHWSMVHH